MRTRNDERLDTRTERRKLEPQAEPYWVVLEKGRSLGYRKGSRTGQWVARLLDPDTGRHRQHGLGSADDFADADGETVLSFSQAQAAARRWFTAGHVRRAALTVQMACDAYLEAMERDGRRTVQRMRTDFKAHLGELADLLLSAVTPVRVGKWLSDLAAKDPRRGMAHRGLRARKVTANRVWSNVRAALNLAATVHGLERPWAGAKPFRVASGARVRFLSPAECTALLDACEGSFRVLVAAALHTGAREGELARITPADLQGGQLWIGPGKTERGRWVILDDAGLAFFAANPPPFHRASGRPWLRKAALDHLRVAMERAGLEPMTFHELRHTYASALLNRGVPLIYVAEQLGHRDTRMVERHYGHLCRTAMASAIRGSTPQGVAGPGSRPQG